MKKIGRTTRRRRKEGKTDYKARLGMLKSRKPRVVVRKTNKYLIGQIVNSEIAQDNVVIGVSSKDLLGNGWPKDLSGSLKNLHACYLTGFLLGKNSEKIKEGVFDIGLQRNIPRSRLNAFLKGLVDSGFSIGFDEEVLPTDEDFKKNEKMQKLVSEIKEKLGGGS